MSTSRDAGRVTVGRIVGAHGIRGAMRLLPLTDFPDRFLDMDRLHVECGGRSRDLDVISISPHEGHGVFLVAVDGVSDRDMAESFRGWLVTVAPDERVELDEGEYWIDSLIGLTVIDAEGGGELGHVTGVMQTGANDVYEITTPEGSRKAVPAIADVVREIDVEAGVMKIKILEGLWD